VAPDYTAAILQRMKALRRTYMDVILDDNHTVCDSIGVISSDPYAFDEGM
jgi:hypothetical protein